MKSMGKNPRGELWEIMIDVNVDGNLGIYIMAQNTSQDSAWDDTNRNIQCVRRESFISTLEGSLKIFNHHPYFKWSYKT